MDKKSIPAPLGWVGARCIPAPPRWRRWEQEVYLHRQVGGGRGKMHTGTTGVGSWGIGYSGMEVGRIRRYLSKKSILFLRLRESLWYYNLGCSCESCCSLSTARRACTRQAQCAQLEVVGNLHFHCLLGLVGGQTKTISVAALLFCAHLHLDSNRPIS